MAVLPHVRDSVKALVRHHAEVVTMVTNYYEGMSWGYPHNKYIIFSYGK